jgi:hypothetical protein
MVNPRARSRGGTLTGRVVAAATNARRQPCAQVEDQATMSSEKIVGAETLHAADRCVSIGPLDGFIAHGDIRHDSYSSDLADFS